MIFILFYNDRFTSHLNKALTLGFKRQSLQENLSFECGYSHIIHVIVDLSLHCLPAYTTQLLLCGLSLTRTHCIKIGLTLGHYVLFLCFRWARALDSGSALPNKKHVFFSAQCAHWIVADLKKKQLISGDKKTCQKKQVYFKR